MSALARMAGVLALGLGAAATGDAGAEVFAHVDPVSGMVVMNNMPAPARSLAPARPAARATATELVPGSALAAAAAAFPRVDPQRQRRMDEDRRVILQDELDHEQRALAGTGATRPAGATAARHAANIAALKRELAAVSGKPIH